MISIIIPVYNGEKSILQCITSLQEQTFKDFEVILINDGSTDGTEKIVEDFTKKDPRFHLINTENKGVSEARNEGLKHVRGEYTCFVDADDYVSSTYLEDFANQMPYDLACQGYILVDDKNYSYPITKESYSKDEALQALLENRSFYSFLWNKSFKTEIIQEMQLNFPQKIAYGEDLWYLYQFLKKAEVVKGIPALNYYYVRHIDSVGRGLTKEKIEKRLTYIDVMIELDNDTKSPEIKKILAKKIATIGVIYLANMKNYGFSSEEIKKEQNRILPYEKQFIKESKNNKEKMKLFLFKTFPKYTRKWTEG